MLLPNNSYGKFCTTCKRQSKNRRVKAEWDQDGIDLLREDNLGVLGFPAALRQVWQLI
jgi:hypothetical protein